MKPVYSPEITGFEFIEAKEKKMRGHRCRAYTTQSCGLIGSTVYTSITALITQDPLMCGLVLFIFIFPGLEHS